MQKKILAAAVAALCGMTTSAFAQQASASKVELWGIVDAAVRHTSNGGKTEMLGGGMSESRWGLKVNENMGGGTSAFVELENRFKSDTGSVPAGYPFFQLAYVGLQGPYGRLSMGRQWNVLFDVVSSTYASFPYSPYMDAYKPELGMAAGARTNNALKYVIATPDRSLAAGLQYSFAEGNDSKKAEQAALNLAATALGSSAALDAPTGAALATSLANPSALPSALLPLLGATTDAVTAAATGAYKTAGGFLRYSKNGYSLGGGFLRTYLPGGSDLDAWTLGGSYRNGPLYVNLGYGQNKFKTDGVNATGTGREFAVSYARTLIDKGIVNNMWQGQTNGGFQMGDADKRQMVKVGFGYQITPQINAGLHYFHAKQKGDVTGKSNGKAHFMIAAVDYAFSKRTDAYFAVDHTKLSGGDAMSIGPAVDGKNITKRTGITVGLRHRF